ncbi:hypothetical protein GOZ97_23320 [Agrobacterium vitis]|uniref:hypothetical protein n=1 Tax=Rhizobium/Agrobacterium group TaxID=227290 RepID=UPI000A56C721|nr:MULTISPECIES: hypothetical protein [Rhizobium/Agrobacterium group]MCF1434913.1 hypothetical protein [Allorhizobium ampelinum]MUO91494.1 hypothetical protein [Agrobacterium vitis]MUZ55081.1 hypothetical protein [Agrobacterium vitis]MUZ94352.1 hypothetical protein [Agrobacterium vitis]MVA42780.1 hypothetical protein [Agrobacterium vitis]
MGTESKQYRDQAAGATYYDGMKTSNLMSIAADTSCAKFTIPYLLRIEHPTRISNEINVADGATMIKPRDIVGSSIKELAFCAHYMHITFSNHYRLTASLAAIFGDEPKEKYVGDIILSVNDCGEGMLIRFLRRWPLLIGAPDEATANPAIMTLRHGSQVLTWQFEHQDAEI